MKDLPLPQHIDPKSPIEIQTETGIVRAFPLRLTHGSGRKKGCVSIEGICHANVKWLKQCFVLFQGRPIRGVFSRVKEVNYRWRFKFETIAPIPEYWVKG